MSAEIVDESGCLLTIKVSGKLKFAELNAYYQTAAAVIKRVGRVRFLTLLVDFQGLENSGEWGDLSFQMEYDSFIEKIAIVGEKQWEETAILFTGKGVRRVAIEYFLPTDLAKAKAWLAES